MKTLQAFVTLFFLACTTGCATRAVETEALIKAPPSSLPRRVEVTNVPFVKQSTNDCGPATLTMAMRWAGRMVTVDELVKQTLTPAAHGTYQTDMISASRRNGLLAIPIRGLPALTTEIAAGHPVIIFENLAFNWYPMYHYALAFGYDLDREEITLHSGPVEAKHWSLYKFERSWMLGDYWGLVVLPPDQLAASADDLAHVTAAVALEQIGYRKEAREIYTNVLARWPASLAALVAMSNLVFADGDVATAASLLERATRLHPDAAAAWHNRAIVQAEMGDKRGARASASRAMALSPPPQRAAYAESLRDYLAH